MISQYQTVFDAIQRAALTGQTQINLRWTKRQYLQAIGLFNSSGYTVTTPPTDGVNSNDNVIQYPLIITWPAVVQGPSITSIIPGAIAGVVGQYLRVEFIPQGGTAPYTFSYTGVVPSGLAFGNLANVDTLVLVGTPSTSRQDVNDLTISVVDATSQTFSQIVSVNIQTNQGTTVVNNITTSAQQAAIGLIIGLS